MWNHTRIRSSNQPVLSNKGKVSCSRKQRGPLMGLEPTTSTLFVRRATHCATLPLVTLHIGSSCTVNTCICFSQWKCMLRKYTRNKSVVLLSKKLYSLLSTGWFQEWIWACFYNQTKINWGPYWRLTKTSNSLPLNFVKKTTQNQLKMYQCPVYSDLVVSSMVVPSLEFLEIRLPWLINIIPNLEDNG